MFDNHDQIEYVDEFGNVIDPSGLGDDVEIVEEYVDDEFDDAVETDEIGFNAADEVPAAEPMDAEPVRERAPAPAPVEDDVDLDDVVVDDAQHLAQARQGLGEEQHAEPAHRRVERVVVERERVG